MSELRTNEEVEVRLTGRVVAANDYGLLVEVDIPGQGAVVIPTPVHVRCGPSVVVTRIPLPDADTRQARIDAYQVMADRADPAERENILARRPYVGAAAGRPDLAAVRRVTSGVPAGSWPPD